MTDHFHLVLCECGSFEHQLLLSFTENEPEMFISFHLADQSFWKRLILGVKYIFGYKSRYGQWGEIILHQSKAKDLFDFINEYIEVRQEYDNDEL